MYQECCNVPMAVAVGVTPETIPFSLDESDWGLSADELGHLLSGARSSSVHTKPPATSLKAIPAKPHTYTNSHLNVWLRAYLPGAGQISQEALKEMATTCMRNDCEWVDKCQVAARKMLVQVLEDRVHGKDRQLASEDPVGLTQLRRNPPLMMAPAIPQFSTTMTHFRFVVDTSDAAAEKDKFFSAHVKIKNEGKTAFTAKVVQRYTCIDGRSPQEGKHDPVVDVDFQVLFDKSVVKKGESATVLFSLIAKADTAFSYVNEVIAIAVEDTVKIFVSFLVINPSLPLFGTSFPCCLSQTICDSPLGWYQAPMVLQLLKHQFIRKQGLACREIGHLVHCRGSMFSKQNAAVLEEAERRVDELDEECTGNDLIQHFTILSRKLCKKGAHSKNRGGEASPRDSSEPSESSSPTGDLSAMDQSSTVSSSSAAAGSPSKSFPSASSQPMGFAPGSVVPVFSPSSKAEAIAPTEDTAHSPGTHMYPPSLSHATPRVLFCLIMLWFSEYPGKLVNESIIGCEPSLTYLDSLEPYEQGLIRWLVDFSCALLMNAGENGTTLRGLALMFAAVVSRRKESSHDARRNDSPRTPSRATGGREPDLQQSVEKIETTVVDESKVAHDDHRGGSDAADDDHHPDFATDIKMHLHVATAFVHWIARFQSLYAKGAKEKK